MVRWVGGDGAMMVPYNTLFLRAKVLNEAVKNRDLKYYTSLARTNP